MSALLDHLGAGATTVARCWRVTRGDGVVLGFTDHDRDLDFEGCRFRAGAGLSARAVSQTTGLAVDNSEAAGALSAAAISEADLVAGRFDGARVEAWMVNWADPTQRMLQFRGAIGEVTRGGGAFQAELRGLTDLLNQPQGEVFQRACSAVLGDGRCRFDLGQPGFAETRGLEAIEAGRLFRFAAFTGFEDRWFERGRLVVLGGAAAGLSGVIKNDRLHGQARVIELWEAIRAPLVAGDPVRIEAGCDRRAETCRLKFDNFLNFRGFPHLPSEDWLTAVPRAGDVNDGGSRG